MQEKFFKLVKTFHRNPMTSERLGNINQLKGTSWKIDLDDFVGEFDSGHDANRRIRDSEVMMI